MSVFAYISLVLIYLVGRRDGSGAGFAVLYISLLLLLFGLGVEITFEREFLLALFVIVPLVSWQVVGLLLDRHLSDGLKSSCFHPLMSAIAGAVLLNIVGIEWMVTELTQDSHSLLRLVVLFGGKALYFGGIVAGIIITSALVLELPFSWVLYGGSRASRTIAAVRPLVFMVFLSIGFGLIMDLFLRTITDFK